MRYRNSHKHTPGKTTDIFDGACFRALSDKNVVVGEMQQKHKYFADHRDVALGLSLDGFAPFNRRTATAWPVVLFNYNLPPDVRFLLTNILALCVIPGPNKPKDIDSFLWPFIREMLRLARGLRAFDVLSKQIFALRAFLIVVFGDMPAVAMIMRMKGPNAMSPCRMCEIVGLRAPNPRVTAHYVPLDRSRHPDVQTRDDVVRVYDPDHLPLRTHEKLLAQGKEVQSASTSTLASDLAREYGIYGVSILSHLHSLSFPVSFPYDFMHLIWENLIKNLVLLWTGNFKGLDEGTESYQLSDLIWEAVGQASAASGSTIPSAYGPRVPDTALHRFNYTAEMWSFWTLYLGPVLLRRRFQRPKYYAHFVALVRLLNICLQFEITEDEIEEIRTGFIKWVREFEQ
jgi:hypothetical protein